MEEWNVGILGIKARNIIIVKNSFRPIIPLLHHSNWGAAPKFSMLANFFLVFKIVGFNPFERIL
jgi:hypothetical protein